MSLLYYYTICLSIIQRLLQYNYMKNFFKDCDFITEAEGLSRYNKDGKPKKGGRKYVYHSCKQGKF